MFEISVNKVGLDFFGSAILPYKIEEITGKAVTEEQITGNVNELINRKLVCRACENRFNPIETSFAQDIYSKNVKKKAKTGLFRKPVRKKSSYNRALGHKANT